VARVPRSTQADILSDNLHMSLPESEHGDQARVLPQDALQYEYGNLEHRLTAEPKWLEVQIASAHATT